MLPNAQSQTKRFVERFADLMMINVRESGHPEFRGTSALSEEFVDGRAVTAHHYFCQSAQYLRSSSGLA